MLILKLFIFAVVIVQSSKLAYADTQPNSHSSASAWQANYFISLINGVVRTVNAQGIHRIDIHGQHIQFFHAQLQPEDVMVFQPLDHQNDIILSSDLKLFIAHQQQLAPLPVTHLSDSGNHIMILHTVKGVFMVDTQNRVMLKVSAGKPVEPPDWATANSGKAVFAFSLVLLALMILIKQLQRHWQGPRMTYINPSPYLPVASIPQKTAVPQKMAVLNKSQPCHTAKPVVLVEGGISCQSDYPHVRLVRIYNLCHLKALAELITPVAVVSQPASHAALKKMMPQVQVIPRTAKSGHTTTQIDTAANSRLFSAECEAMLAVSGAEMPGRLRAMFIQDILNAKVKSAEQAEFFARFMAVLQQQYDNESCNMAEVADALATSQRNFSRKLKQVFGAGFTDLLKQYRLCRSCDALLQGNRVTQVAISAGFGTASYYAKCFKQYAGTTPRKFQLEYETPAHHAGNNISSLD
ncbi:helix-turn-helix transcriptional regulator [Salinimonas lutimaris]|uniref:helix-turn-helix transcriptional regulator n=1 Tax=Salinimonas lutimaris TaxID=914153 RepID=UPI0010C1155F|nr:helix-turn-helix transcriptional regulator [Salinimonas lutimaris]